MEVGHETNQDLKLKMKSGLYIIHSPLQPSCLLPGPNGRLVTKRIIPQKPYQYTLHVDPLLKPQTPSNFANRVIVPLLQRAGRNHCAQESRPEKTLQYRVARRGEVCETADIRKRKLKPVEDARVVRGERSTLVEYASRVDERRGGTDISDWGAAGRFPEIEKMEVYEIPLLLVAHEAWVGYDVLGSVLQRYG